MNCKFHEAHCYNVCKFLFPHRFILYVSTNYHEFSVIDRKAMIVNVSTAVASYCIMKEKAVV